MSSSKVSSLNCQLLVPHPLGAWQCCADICTHTPADTSRCRTHTHMHACVCASSPTHLQDSEPITCLALSPDKHSLVAASRSLSVRLWDWTTGECRRTWKVGTHTPPAAAVTAAAAAAAKQPHVAAFSTNKEQSPVGSHHWCSQASAAAALLLPQLTIPTRVPAIMLPLKRSLSLPPPPPPPVPDASAACLPHSPTARPWPTWPLMRQAALWPLAAVTGPSR